MIELVRVRYGNGVSDYFLPMELDIKKGDMVIVATARGLQLGEVITNKREYSEKDVPMDIFSVKRIATEEDFKKQQKNIDEAARAKETAKKLVKELGLDMKIEETYYTFDRNQLLFTFLSDSRVDFRALAKKLAQIYHTRIELCQIGVRDRAKDIGGLGPCGRFLCCKQFLTDFASVSINMAKNQYIALNPNKINGICGRLLCCLKYEDEQYREMKKGVPKIGQMIDVNGTRGKVASINLLTNQLVLELPNRTYVEYDLGEVNGSIK